MPITDTADNETKILAFRLPKKEAETLLKKAKPEESPSELLRRVVKQFLSTK